jgi:paraquat-inducible protein A
MIDVLVVAILVSLIQLGGLMAIRPGSAALAFCGVVIVTMLAAESIDPRLMWERVGSTPNPRLERFAAESRGDFDG